MKKLPTLLAICLACALACGVAAAQTQIGQWTLRLAYHDATQNIAAGNRVYALFNGNLLVHNPADNTVDFIEQEDGLTGKNILHMGYSDTQQCLTLVYDDGNIDLLYADGSVANLPQYKLNPDAVMQINGLNVMGDDAFVCTGEGFIWINLARQEVKGYYKVGPCNAAALLDGHMLAAVRTAGVMQCALTDNMYDPARWSPLTPQVATRLLPFADGIYLYAPATGIWWTQANADGSVAEPQLLGGFALTACHTNGQRATFVSAEEVRIYENGNHLTPSRAWIYSNEWQGVSLSTANTLWASEGTGGLRSYTLATGTIRPDGNTIGNYGPPYDLFYHLRIDAGRLLVAGGRLDNYDIEHNPFMATIYEDDKWAMLETPTEATCQGTRFTDATSIVQDPSDPAHMFVSTAGTGLYEYRNGKIARQYTHGNSPLRSSDPNGSLNYVRTDGLSYDAAGNLWVVNNQCDTVLRVLKPNGSWKGIYVAALSQAPTVEKTLIDSKGRLWVCSRRTVDNHTAGLLCLDYNGTIDNTADDVATYRTSFTNQDGTSYTLDGVYAVAEDRDGAIWVGTAHGPFVITDPDSWHTSGFYVTQVKIPRNDGTNYADYLLSDVPVTALAIDGANRKWIGTSNNGVYLVSADGVEQIHHFTADNSPLLSDNIYAIATHPATGEVFIGTDKGLVSYVSDASESATELTRSDIKVYPNPVRPDYSGPIVVQGLTDGAEVKVTTAGGQVVAAGHSNGGTFTWDGRNLGGVRVASGVYYFLIANANGSKSVAAKVAVVR